MSTSLLIHCDGASFIDASGKTVTPVGNAVVSTLQAAALAGNVASGKFDGTGDYLSVADHADFDFGSGDSTIELWFRPNAIGVAQQLCTKRASTAVYAPWLLQMNSSGQIIMGASTTGAAWAAYAVTTYALAANTWYHIALCRVGTTLTLYVGGVARASAALTGALMVNTSAVLVGGDTNTYSVNGYIDEVRLSKGASQYTADFSVPTSPFAFGGVSAATFSIATSSLSAWVAPPVASVPASAAYTVATGSAAAWGGAATFQTTTAIQTGSALSFSAATLSTPTQYTIVTSSFLAAGARAVAGTSFSTQGSTVAALNSGKGQLRKTSASIATGSILSASASAVARTAFSVAGGSAAHFGGLPTARSSFSASAASQPDFKSKRYNAASAAIFSASALSLYGSFSQGVVSEKVSPLADLVFIRNRPNDLFVRTD